MSKLHAFGDSFTWGSDLKDETSPNKSAVVHNYKTLAINKGQVNHFTTTFNKVDEYKSGIKCVTTNYQPNNTINWGCDTNPKHSILTWPALLAFNTKRDYVCYGIPGASNHTIVREFFRRINTINHNDIVVVNWTWIDRWDFYNKEVKNNWLTLRPNDSSGYKKIYNFYYKYLQSELWNKLESLKNIALVLNTLKTMKVKIIMTAIDDLVFDTKYHCPPYIETLQNNIQDDIIKFNNMNFLDWSRLNNFSISEGFHPLEEAHNQAFNYIKEHYEIT